MNIKFRAKILLSVLMLGSAFFRVGDFSFAYGMKRRAENTVESTTVHNMLRLNEESLFNGSGLSHYQIALHREWFNLLSCGSIQRLRIFLSLHDEEDCLNWVDSLGVTSLNYAILQGQIEVVRFLLSNGANVNALDTLERTPLMCAHYYIYHNYDATKGYDMINLLCDCNPDVNVVGAFGNTVLHLAAYSGNEYLYNRFVLMGGNEDIVNNFADSPRSLYGKAFQMPVMQ